MKPTFATRFTKSRYKIKEVSEIIGVPPSTLRYWESEFDQIQPERNDGNRRTYRTKDVEALQIIHYLLHVKGLKIEAAKEYLKHNKKNITKRFEVIKQLESIKADLELLLESLNIRNQFL